MKILITGQQGLAQSLARFLAKDHEVITISRQTGHDIQQVKTWAPDFYHCDMLINSAYHRWSQVEVLEQFFWAWHQDPAKIIVNIGSSISDYARTDREKDHEYMDYRTHKQALQLAFNRLTKQGMCDIKLINPGAMDTDMVRHLAWTNKMSTDFVAEKILPLLFDPCMKRVDLWQ